MVVLDLQKVAGRVGWGRDNNVGREDYFLPLAQSRLHVFDVLGYGMSREATLGHISNISLLIAGAMQVSGREVLNT